MAVQIETQGQLSEFLEVLGRRRWLVILPAAIVITLGIAVAVLIPKKYLVKTQVELRPVGISVSSKDGANAPFQIPARERVKKVVQDLKKPEYLALPPEEQGTYIASMQSNIKVTLGRGTETTSNFVNVQYQDVDVQWAVVFLRALRDDWINDVLERDRNKVADEVKRLQGERETLEKQYTQEEEKLTELKRANAISATQPIPGSEGARGEDPAFERLTANQKLLDQVIIDISVTESKIVDAGKRYQDTPEKLTSEELKEGVNTAAEVQEKDRQIHDLETQLSGYRPPHSKYPKIKEKIAALQEERDELARLVTKGELRTLEAKNPIRNQIQLSIDGLITELATLHAKEKALSAAIERDSHGVNELYPVYRKIRESLERIDRLKSALFGAEASYQAKVREAKLLQSPLANPFQITEEVAPPPVPTEPNPLLIAAFGLVAGLALGVGLAVFAEYSRNCFRTVQDLSRVMVTPVLGTVNQIVTRKEARLVAARRVTVALASLLIVGGVSFVTWAWAKNPELLSPDLREKIESVRSKFR